MRQTFKSVRWIGPFAFVFFLCAAAQAGRPDRGAFLSTKEEIRRLAVERIRTAPSDYERVVVAGETRLRSLHNEFNLAGATAPTVLDGDLNDLRGACQKAQRLVTAGRPPTADPVAQQIVARHWSIYRGEIDALSRQILDIKGERSESQIYWETLRTFKALKDRTQTTLLFNTPPGEHSLEEALSRDESALLKACEITAKKTHGSVFRVVTPHEFLGSGKPDIQAFYRSLDLVPDARPLRTGSIVVPPGARTVTLRENAARLVFRPKKGKGIAYVGQTETELNYDYLAVPPDTAYYFENTGPDPLELEFVGIKP